MAGKVSAMFGLRRRRLTSSKVRSPAAGKRPSGPGVLVPTGSVHAFSGPEASFGIVGSRLASQWNMGAPTGFSDSALAGLRWMTHVVVLDVGPHDCADLTFHWPNWAAIPAEVDNHGSIKVSAALVGADGDVCQLLWGGFSTVTILPGQTVHNDPCPLLLEGGTRARLVINVSATNQHGFYPCTAILHASMPGEGIICSGVELSDPGNVPILASTALSDLAPTMINFMPVYAPIAAFGAIARPVPRVLVLGDSIADGVGDDDDGIHLGYVMRALGTAIPVMRITAAGDMATMIEGCGDRRRRLRVRCGATHCIYQAGSNDLVHELGFEALRTVTRRIWDELNGRGMRIHACTLVPRTFSSDGWTTTGGQTVPGWEQDRQSYNAWLRGGADGQIADCIDPDVIADPARSGVWDVSTGIPVQDGTHPTTQMAVRMAAAIDPAMFGPRSG